jgi:hypothetical protein
MVADGADGQSLICANRAIAYATAQQLLAIEPVLNSAAVCTN